MNYSGCRIAADSALGIDLAPSLGARLDTQVCCLSYKKTKQDFKESMTASFEYNTTFLQVVAR